MKSSKKISAADPATYEKRLAKFNEAKAKFERAKTGKAEAKTARKSAGEDLDKHDRYILDKTYKKAKHKKKYKKHVLKIARKRLESLPVPEGAEKSYSLADAEGASRQSPANEPNQKAAKKSKKKNKLEQASLTLKAPETKPDKKASAAIPTTEKKAPANVEKLHSNGKVEPKNTRMEPKSAITSTHPNQADTLREKAPSLSASKPTAPAAPPPPAPVSEKKRSPVGDDLTQIEGVGPKIAELLKSQGIGSMLQLSQTSAERLKACLATGGPRYSLHNPSSWPQQAKLLQEGKLEEFNKLKAELKGGRILKR